MRTLPRPFDRPVTIAGLFLVLSAGCADPAEPPAVTPVEPREAPWAEQIAAVRASDSDAVRVSGKPVTIEQWAMLADGCESLAVLEADVRRLAPNDLDLLAQLPNLRRLVLHGPVDDAMLEHIAALSTLKNLNFPDAEFSDAGMQALTALPDLELLRFRSPHVTDEGMAAIAALPALRFLHLIDVPITDAGLVHLHGMTDLESFYLDGSRCTDDGLHALLNALPELHFHRDQLHLPGDPHTHPHE